MTTTLDHPPNMRRVYARALFQRRPAFSGEQLPALRTRLPGMMLAPDHVAKYREACGARAEVPVGYPQLLATRLHVAMLTEDEFPLRAMGLVHPRFSITQHRPLKLGETLTFDCWFDGLRDVRNGVEFDIKTRALVGEELVFDSVAVTFHRTQRSSGGKRPPEEERTWKTTAGLVVPANAGRRYARVSGDANPVHLHPLTSRLFGYKRPIAHGWWLVARCLAELDSDCPSDPTVFEFDFRRPVFLGGRYELVSRSDGDALDFAVLDDGGKTRLLGGRRPA